MPIYEYQCGSCGQKTELLQGISDAAPACKDCGVEMQRIMSTTGGIVIRESGGAPAGTCCGQQNGCDNPKRCCGS